MSLFTQPSTRNRPPGRRASCCRRRHRHLVLPNWPSRWSSRPDASPTRFNRHPALGETQTSSPIARSRGRVHRRAKDFADSDGSSSSTSRPLTISTAFSKKLLDAGTVLSWATPRPARPRTCPKPLQRAGALMPGSRPLHGDSRRTYRPIQGEDLFSSVAAETPGFGLS